MGVDRMNDASSRALPQFLRFVSAHPEGGHVAEALTKGPLATINARSSIIWMRSGADQIRIVGSHGTDARSEVRFSVVPLSVAFPACQAIIDQRPLVHTWHQLADQFPVLLLDGDVFERNRVPSPDGGMVTAPILVNGASVGAWATHVTALPAPGPQIDDLVRGVSGALGLWLTHPSTPVIDAPIAAGDEEPVALTQRQREVLHLVLEGLTNAQIAERLHTSRSTIKHELHHATRSMRVSDRMLAARRARDLGILDDSSHGTVPA